MRCEKCGNSCKELFIYKNKEFICRKCLMYKETVKENDEFYHGDGKYYLNYSLTKFQKEASDFVLDNIKNRKDCVLNAITGSGKTEIIYNLIQYSVNNNLKIGIVIPRKDVVIELYNRLKNDFSNTSITSVYGGNNKILYADIIVLTTHQLYRYKKYFDVIVIDEVDAFPFDKNEMLNNFLKRSLKGNIVYMSATIPEYLSKNNIHYLNKRYHGEKLDSPKVKYMFYKFNINKFINNHKNDLVLIYFPTIKEQLKFSKKFKRKHYIINSKSKNRNQLLKEFHGLKRGIILTTLVLERGITFSNCHVIVYKADHSLFTYANLVQISGRVGRKKDYPKGDILFLANKKNKHIRKAMRYIKKANE